MLINKTNGKMENSTVVNGITYTILAEEKLVGKAAEIQSNYTHMLMLRRPKGIKEFWAMRTATGEVELV